MLCTAGLPCSLLSPAAFYLQSILPEYICFIRISIWLCFLAETVKSSVSWQWTINTRNVSQLRGSWGDDCDCLPSPPTQLHRYPQNTTLLWQVSRIRKIKNNFCVFCLIMKLLSSFTILQHDIKLKKKLTLDSSSEMSRRKYFD